MDVQVIEKNIELLEGGETTLEAIEELAMLYTVRDGLKNAVQTKNDAKIDAEFDDLFPAYQNYVKAKRSFQIYRADEEAVLKYLHLLCQELKEFVLILYEGTDLRKERQCIKDLCSALNKRFSED